MPAVSPVSAAAAIALLAGYTPAALLARLRPAAIAGTRA